MSTSLKRGGASVGGSCAPLLAGGIGNWAHIPHERGGAPCAQNSVVVSELGSEGDGGFVEGGKMNPTSTVSMVDVEFKLHPRPKQSCSILRHTSMIMKINLPYILKCIREFRSKI